MGNLAATYRNKRRWPEAEALEVQVIETSKTKLRADYPDMLASMNNVAFMLKSPSLINRTVSLIEDCYKLGLVVFNF
ncbi:hypothetical protein DM02DRAFT_537436 [Periconia macrospinosa]|uniref:Uncharacterized protein n=1 Tax=Periconia macrospinosa TaxID=97972 RepID=A0A2V1DCX0_9PLEO|nr:hypothetical protein DM02DRAFT_543029 [Periconia macrospinosa]PVH95433.1 hypothetical protein DM02DRAFT_537436 [Periconia macrospinosa]